MLYWNMKFKTFGPWCKFWDIGQKYANYSSKNKADLSRLE